MWNILLPVGEGTTMLRHFVLPRVLENFVNILKWVKTYTLNVKVFLCNNEQEKYNSVLENNYS